ncbi:MAG: hypothetical protein ACKVPY_00660 [Paracoccaceae bacterium]
MTEGAAQGAAQGAALGAALVGASGLSRIDRAGTLTGAGVPGLIAAWARHGCRIDLIALTKKGGFGGADWVAGARAALVAAGVAEGDIRVVDGEGGLRPCDLLFNLEGFGDRHKVKHLGPVLARGLHAEARMVLDIRRGSGSYPFLKDYGAAETLSERDEGGVRVTRALFTPAPPAEAPLSGGWAEIARGLAGQEGFFDENGMHSFLYVPRSPDVLVVTFDNLDIAMGKREDRRPWGYGFIEAQGWSMLGVMANGWTWYRDPWVAGEFDRLRDEGFFRRFGRVVFYGASMGGYAACAFVGAAEGAEAVAISPQSTLDKRLVPWETRYKAVWDRDFSGPYGDAAEASRAAAKVTILYDPYEPLDAGHVARFTGANVVRLRTPLMGHRLGSSLSQMGILSGVMLKALDGSLSEAGFYRALRARRDFPRYQRELFERAVARGRPGLARQVGRWVLARGDNRAIKAAMRGL